MIIVAIAIGGMIGALLRHYVSIFFTTGHVGGFPLGILVVNIVGSLMMGFLIGFSSKILNIPMELRAFFAVGLLGSFTTFSTFALDVVTLFERGDIMQSLIYLCVSVVGAICALAAGLYIMRLLA